MSVIDTDTQTNQKQIKKKIQVSFRDPTETGKLSLTPLKALLSIFFLIFWIKKEIKKLKLRLRRRTKKKNK